MRKKIGIFFVTLILVSSAIYAAKIHTVGQKDRKFTVSELSIAVGDSVDFPNQDEFFHNVYSLSPAKIFDLGSYKKGESKKVIFDKAGVVEVKCAIHPDMKMIITVK
ncbi:MAG: plastocyanin/azurin family copper-binding protein [Leptospiraceae bacterium]|nr:plastocyanin/azurin family copper-binding protein [Leptospiraceae bacterium]